MEWLKELLKEHVAEDKLDEVVKAFNAESPKHVIPKDVFNEKSTEAKTLKGQLDEYKKQVESLSEKAGTVEEYQQQIEKLKTDYTELEAKTQQEITNITKKTAYEKALINSGVHKDAIDLLLSSTKLDELDTEKLDEQINNLKEQRPGLFVEEKQQSKDTGETNAPTATKDPREMNMQEYAAWFEQQQVNRKTL